MKKIAPLFIALVLFFNVFSVSYAEVFDETQSNIISIKSSEEMEKNLKIDEDGLFYLDGIDKHSRNAEYSILKENLLLTNSMINNGYLKANSDGKIKVTDRYVEYVKKQYEETGYNYYIYADGNSIVLSDNF